MEQQIAEFVGIMLGDGNFGIYKSRFKNQIKTQHRIRISLDSRNEGYIDYVCNLVEKILDVKPKKHYKKKENSIDIGIYRKDKFFYVLNKIGLIESPKKNRMEIPKKYYRKELFSFILKGLFDTDGSLTIFNNNGTIYPRIEIKVCPSPSQKQIVEMLNELNFNYKVQNLEKGWIRFRISGVKELRRWFDVVGSSNTIHIEKSKKFL